MLFDELLLYILDKLGVTDTHGGQLHEYRYQPQIRDAPRIREYHRPQYLCETRIESIPRKQKVPLQKVYQAM